MQPYTFHTRQNTSKLIAALDKIDALVFNVILQLMLATIAAVLAVAITGALIAVDAVIAAAAAVSFGLVYAGVSALTRKRLERNSEALSESYDRRIQIVQESLGGIRDIIIDSSQPLHVESFRQADKRMVTARANTAFISSAPRYIIEALGIAVLAGLAVFLADRSAKFDETLPVLGALALGAQRLLPLLQQVYSGWTTAQGNRSIVEQVLELLQLPLPLPATARPARPALSFREAITFENVSFDYGARQDPALSGISLTIPRGAKVALVGKTGSGKSTLADLVMGLLAPTSGRILVDSVELSEATRGEWRRSIAHVPQFIFLADTSIARNIALAASDDQVDQGRVEDAARQAQLHGFLSGLPDGYQTQIGERGIRLSGGQRQRLGIARAIYKQAPVLVLDEATSALDDETEAAVMRAIDDADGEQRTVIMIAHRLSTLTNCDLAARLDRGRLVEFGPYANLLGSKRQ
jgi:ABC-type multidrug transport system fused ATPase/permease subunit